MSNTFYNSEVDLWLFCLQIFPVGKRGTRRTQLIAGILWQLFGGEVKTFVIDILSRQVAAE